MKVSLLALGLLLASLCAVSARPRLHEAVPAPLVLLESAVAKVIQDNTRILHLCFPTALGLGVIMGLLPVW